MSKFHYKLIIKKYIITNFIIIFYDLRKNNAAISQITWLLEQFSIQVRRTYDLQARHSFSYLQLLFVAQLTPY